MKLSIPQLAAIVAIASLCQVASAQYYPHVPSGPYRPWTATPSYSPARAVPATGVAEGQTIQQVSTHPVAENLLTTPEAKQALAEQPADTTRAEVVAVDTLTDQPLVEPQILATSTRRTKSFEQRVAELEAQLAALEMGAHTPMVSGCSSCGDCGVSCGCAPKKECKTGGFVAGVEMVFVTPYFEENTAFTIESIPLVGPITNTAVPFEYDLALAPRAYIGYEFASGLGARGRYFQYDQDASTQTFVSDLDNNSTAFFQRANFPTLAAAAGIEFGTLGLGVFPEPGSTTVAQSELSIEIIDIELTKAFSGTGWNMLLAGGLRYMKMEQMYRIRSETADQLVFSDLGIDRDFDGLGPSAALRISAPIGTTNVAVFADMRGSLLYGQNKQFYRVSTEAIPGDTLTLENDDVIGILELQLGTEYSYRLSNGMRLFANVAGEGQLWLGGGSAFNQDNAGSEADGNFGLAGFTVGGGIAR